MILIKITFIIKEIFKNLNVLLLNKIIKMCSVNFINNFSINFD
jgi:hypothetical protein